MNTNGFPCMGPQVSRSAASHVPQRAPSAHAQGISQWLLELSQTSPAAQSFVAVHAESTAPLHPSKPLVQLEQLFSPTSKPPWQSTEVVPSHAPLTPPAHTGSGAGESVQNAFVFGTPCESFHGSVWQRPVPHDVESSQVFGLLSW